MRVYKGDKNFYVLEVPRAKRADIAALMAYRGLIFSTSASSAEKAVLFTDNPYALADLANGECPELAPYRAQIDASRALTGTGTRRLPPGRELKEYQKATLDYLLARGGGINGDAPGLGKTPTSIAFCNAVEAYRILVICPAGVVRTQWQDRIKEWSTIPNVKISVMTKVKDGIHPFAHYQIISFESARNPNIIRAISKYQWDVMIVDEAHRCANVNALTSRAVLGNSRGEYQHGDEKMPAIGTYARQKLALTGTLLRNRPGESYNLLRYFDHESIEFMSEEKFKARYNQQADMRTLTGKRWKLESTSLEFELQNRLRVNVMARHVKSEIPEYDRPPRYNLVRVEENGAVKTALEAEGLLDLDIDEVSSGKISIEEQGHIAEVRRIMGTAIAPQIADYAREFLDGSEEKLVVFTWHYAVTDILVEQLSRFGVVWLDGRKSPAKKKIAVDEFRQNDKIRVFVGNIQAAGTGTDGLQEVCSHCFIAEPDWVPSNMEQPVSRLDRIGQGNVVNADIFVAPGSISEKILIRALEKMNVINRVMDKKRKISVIKIYFNIEADNVGELKEALHQLVRENITIETVSEAAGLGFGDMEPGMSNPADQWSPEKQEEFHAQDSEALVLNTVPAAAPAPAEDVILDAHGHPWSADLHASTKGKTQDGLWRMGRGKERPAPVEGYPKNDHVPEAPAPKEEPVIVDMDAGTIEAVDEEDEFAAFRTAETSTDAIETNIPEREWSDADLSKIANWAANKLGSPVGVMAVRDKYIPAGHVAKTNNIPVDDRERFAQELEKLAGATYEG